jgi:small subunit ribosomal protein S3
MARREMYREGRVPLTTLRADVDYGFYESRTKYGRIGCKVWIYRGEILPSGEEERIRQAAKERVRRRTARRQRPAEAEGAVATEAAATDAPNGETPAAPETSAPPETPAAPAEGTKE